MKTIKTITMMCLAAALLVISPATVLAGSVSYAGQAKGFVFTPGGDTSPTNLFANAEDLVPGDTITETIEVKNDSAEKKPVRFYLRALGAEEGSEDFLSQLKLHVKQGKNTLFEAAADQKGGLADWVLLGTLAAGASEKLEITLEVPITMGNEYQDKLGVLSWEFKIEEDGDAAKAADEKTKANPASTKGGIATAPKTGDAGVTPYVLLMGAAAAAVITGVSIKRRRS